MFLVVHQIDDEVNENKHLSYISCFYHAVFSNGVGCRKNEARVTTMAIREENLVDLSFSEIIST